MRERTRRMNYLWSFGKLLKKMRGTTSLENLAKKTGLDAGFLADIESGRTPAHELEARHLLVRGFKLTPADTDRLVLGIALYDLGLRDGDLRQMVVDLIRAELPSEVREQIKQLYRRHGRSAT